MQQERRRSDGRDNKTPSSILLGGWSLLMADDHRTYGLESAMREGRGKGGARSDVRPAVTSCI